MARVVDGQPSVPLQRGVRKWGQLLATQRAGIKLYQWLWLLFCVGVALAITTPRVLNRPVVYVAQAETRFAAERYGGLYVDDAPGPDFQVAQADATNAFKQRFLDAGELRFSSPNFRVEYIPQEPGVVHVRGIAPIPTEAQELADQGAAELVRQIRAAGGREVLRNLLGWEQGVALDGGPPDNQFQIYLRDIIKLGAFPLNRDIEPIAETRLSVADLLPEEQNDLTRALESRYDLWTFEINTRNATLDAACGTTNLARAFATAAREAALDTCAAANEDVARELAARDQAIARRGAIEAALRYLLTVQGTEFAPDAPGAVQRVPATLPTDPEPRYIVVTLALAIVVGLTFGGIGVTIDRTAGVMPKIHELWTYRELIKNLVLRDLRVRYKGSALGYLWTQLAPLLMMLIFWVVFSAVFASPIAMFPIFLIVALLPWNYCAEATLGGTRSVLDNANLIKKVFFPREVLPLVSVCSSLVNFLLSLPMLFLVMTVVQLFYPPLNGQLNFAWTVAYLPVLLLIQTLFLAGVAFFLGALAVFFRDTVHLVGILVQFWFFLTPIFYSIDGLVSGVFARALRWFNPMASIVEFYREILYGNTVGIDQIPQPALPAPDSVLRVLVTSLLVLAIGYWFFQRSSRQFGEEI